MLTPRFIDVDTSSGRYPIVISDEDGQAWTSPLSGLVARRRTAVVTDQTVYSLYADDLRRALKDAGAGQISWHVVPPGEVSKSQARLWQLYGELLDSRLGRDGLICALGGGVVGDLAGFAAATLYRGVDHVQLPTTLLAMVDSSIGGKTGINCDRGKNLIGAFHHPKAVLVNLRLLQSLASVELRNGLAEVIKYGVILDAALFEWLEESESRPWLPTGGQLLDIVLRSATIKSTVVGRDERDQHERALLNYGHTIGHAIERARPPGSWSHGQAVAVGMILAAELGVELGITERSVTPRLRALCQKAELPVRLDPTDIDALGPYIEQDKKVRGDRIHIAVPVELGRGRVHPIEVDELIRWLAGHRGL